MSPVAIPRFFAGLLALGLLLSGGTPLNAGKAKEERIHSAFARKLDAIQFDPRGFHRFCQRHPDLFPSGEYEKWVKVRKEKLRLEDGSEVSVGAAYSQVFIPASMERVIRYLESPEWFRDLYDLDADARWGHGPNTGDGCFQARIFKRVPLLPDQDFVLGFSRVWHRDVWYQRGRLVKDRKAFALRDNLKILTPFDGGVVYREISLVYPMRWWARMMGPTFRKVMRREVRRMLGVLRCVISAGPVPERQRTMACWENARRD